MTVSSFKKRPKTHLFFILYWWHLD